MLSKLNNFNQATGFADKKYESIMNDISTFSDKKDQTTLSPQQRIQSVMKSIRKQGPFTSHHLSSAGLEATENEGETKCRSCGLTISKWTPDMDPFKTHSKLRPDCSFVCSVIQSPLPSSNASSISSTNTVRNTSIPNEQENPSKRQKVEKTELEYQLNILFETPILEQVRRRGFSHWPHRTIPSSAQMIEAGFFNCNVGDRVICIYCNLICQQWTPHTDDPCEVHKILSPKCIYVKAKLMRPVASSIVIVNENTTAVGSSSYSSSPNNFGSLRSNDIVFTAPCNPMYSEIPKRHASYITWPNENLPSVDDLVRAGFFYTGTKTIVTCFYCNGSLQNWGATDNPMIEHARWFPHCAYAKQLCGDDLYRKIQESKRAQQERTRANDSKERLNSTGLSNSGQTASSRQLLIPDESTLSRFVAARLDLPISQRLLDMNVKLSIIKRCYEDQLRIKHDDFASDCDLYIACLILQKQIEHIDGKKENIVIPSIKMKQIREQNETRTGPQTTTSPNTIQSTPPIISADIEMTTTSQASTNESESSQSSVDSTSKSGTNNGQNEIKIIKQLSSSNDQNQSANSTPSNPCVLCLTEEKRLACIPCGHMATCVACGHSLRSCPICRREIEAFVRIYI